MNKDCLLQLHSISPEETVRGAMKRLNELSGDSMTLFVIDNDHRILGTVTDGDIRRALIAGGELDHPVEAVMKREFLFASSLEDLSIKMAQGRKRHIELLPVLKDGKAVDMIDLRVTKAILPVEAVMMAGGRGERLRPLTDDTPKPLLPVADKPILEHNIEELEAYGIRKIYVTVNYLKEMIISYCLKRDGRATIKCVEEPKRLGTFGSLAYIDDVASDDIIVMNSDLLSAIDFEAMYLHHKHSKADFTIAAVPYSVSVPFAIMRMQGNWVKALEEKPTYNYFANGGVYIMKSDLMQKIIKGEYLDAPDFIMSLISEGKNVGCYHLEGSWVDIGSPDDYRLANELASRKL